MSFKATLGAATDDRKARLAKLRSIKRKQPDDEIVPPESERDSPALSSGRDGASGLADDEAQPDVSRIHLSGRNYDPETRGAKLGFEAPPSLAAGDNTLEAKAAALEAETLKHDDEAEEHGEQVGAGGIASGKEIDLFKLQPKKPNWDLKRELNKRLEPLNVRTENAIAKLVRERLASKQLQPKEESLQHVSATGEKAITGATLEGVELVEGLRQREKAEEEEERRDREAEAEDTI